ncbi:MAG: sugar transferase [Lachnospiraceae bacterium]|nr:sugar transferase [Lachnospiraceae bacterium]
MYAKFFKRVLDFTLSFVALLVLSPFLLILLITGAAAMKGNPVFVQPRPGKKDRNGKERIFYLFKLRTMSNAKDKNGKLLSDEVRLNAYGRFLRSTSADELPSLINILKGDMAIVGPRPQLVRDMVFMTPEQRKRHNVRPGLTGLAQCSGRNHMTWEKKFAYDLQYINEGITFRKDAEIILKTIVKVFQRDGITEEGKATAEDLGDYLLREGKVEKDVYAEKNREAERLIQEKTKNDLKGTLG